MEIYIKNLMNKIPNSIPHQEIIALAEQGALQENHAARAPLAHQITHLPFVPVAPDRKRHQDLI